MKTCWFGQYSFLADSSSENDNVLNEIVQLSGLHSEIDATVQTCNVSKKEQTNKKSTTLIFLLNVASHFQSGGPENTKATKETRPLPQMWETKEKIKIKTVKKKITTTSKLYLVFV